MQLFGLLLLVVLAAGHDCVQTNYVLKARHRLLPHVALRSWLWPGPPEVAVPAQGQVSSVVLVAPVAVLAAQHASGLVVVALCQSSSATQSSSLLRLLWCSFLRHCGGRHFSRRRQSFLEP